MSRAEQTPDYWQVLWQELTAVGRTALDGWRNLGVHSRNALRHVRRARLDYVILPVGGPLPERDEPPRSFLQRQLPLPPPPQTLQTLNRQLQAVADAPNVRGVIFVFQELTAGLATLQNFRRSVERLRAAGKEAIVYTPTLDLPNYFAAAAADRIIAPPGVQFAVLGLRAEVIFLKDALAQVGVHVDVVPISAYKTGANALSEADMTPAQREQLDWLLDEQFDLITSGIAAGRGKSQADVEALINRAPLFAEEALAAGLIDHLAYEDELAHLLAPPKTAVSPPDSPDADAAADPAPVAESEPDRPAKAPRADLLTWDAAAPRLLEKARRHGKPFIGVISLEGSIVMGTSRQPPIDLPLPFVGGAMAGEQTLVHLIRLAAEMPQMAALILHVDSPGGSSLASDLIGREVQRLSLQKPVLVYMGNVAASGGYYVSAPARHIMSQTGTMTGSIGVFTVRVSVDGLYERFKVNAVYLDRGERAGLYRNTAPMTPDERALYQESIVYTYDQFKQVVANGRNLPIDALDSICQGRVWSGRQALQHRLVDSHGDFVDAVRQAAALAELPTDDEHAISVINLFAKSSDYVAPRPFQPDALAAAGRWLSGRPWQQVSGQPLLLMPFHIRH